MLLLCWFSCKARSVMEVKPRSRRPVFLRAPRPNMAYYAGFNVGGRSVKESNRGLLCIICIFAGEPLLSSPVF